MGPLSLSLLLESFSDMSRDRFIDLIKQWNHVQNEKKNQIYLKKHLCFNNFD